MVHASVILSCAFPPKIMLDKPQITEKLTNAWHLLNIHYSDTSSEFQKAERMLNQHSYSQSEPRRHIAARLGADENGTLGPDLKNIQRLHARDLRVWGVGGWRLGLCLQEGDVFQKRGHLPLLHTLLPLRKSFKWRIIAPKFIHNTENRRTQRTLTFPPSFLPSFKRLSLGTKGGRTEVPL